MFTDPTVMEAFNLSKETTLRNATGPCQPEHGMHPALEAITRGFPLTEPQHPLLTFTHYVVQAGANGERKGIVPTMSAELRALRKGWKAKLKAAKKGGDAAAARVADATQNAIKVVGNSLCLCR